MDRDDDMDGFMSFFFVFTFLSLYIESLYVVVTLSTVQNPESTIKCSSPEEIADIRDLRRCEPVDQA